MKRLLALAALAAPLAGCPLPAAALQLGLPIDCSYGVGCYVQNYVDHDPQKHGFTDFHCGTLTYDGHKGSDFRIPTLVDMHHGVDVLAAAGGTVLRTRDGMADVSVRQTGYAAIKGRECGNGVVIDHGDGWESEYCHMKKGSVTVKTGDAVKAGQRLGEVGLSGDTEFPHVHFQLTHLGQIVDPFTGTAFNDTCTTTPVDGAMWKRNLPYIATGMLHAGFAGDVPKEPMDLANRRNELTPTPHSPYLIFDVLVMGVQKGDTSHMALLDAKGKVIAQKDEVIERNQAEYLRYLGMKSPGTLHGAYQGQFILQRPGVAAPVVSTAIPVGIGVSVAPPLP